jgi:3-deoxy-D-manno-octulosonic-acid transferase
VTLRGKCKALIGLYDLLWPLAIPALWLAPRLREGFAERLLRTGPDGFVDVWMQAASGGEAYLVRELALALPEAMAEERPLRILATTNTRQGREVLERAAAEVAELRPGVSLIPAYCPFDQPSLMARAMEQTSPRVLVLLETEIWPGLLAAAKEFDVPVVLANARMNARSLAGYLCAGALLRELAPERILAVSDEAALRFALLFGAGRVERMHNIKFDRFPALAPGAAEGAAAPKAGPVAAIMGDGRPWAVLASVRRQEEQDALAALREIRAAEPGAGLAVFPRHMHRLDFWRRALYEAGLSPVMRSALSSHSGPPAPGAVVLWDTFGELAEAYAFCTAAFVGGSLRPLGGQNFLEPLAHGVVPVIGPHWSNFAWIGREIVNLGLAVEVDGPRELAGAMVAALRHPAAREDVRARVAAYVNDRRGGTRQAAERIASYL